MVDEKQDKRIEASIELLEKTEARIDGKVLIVKGPLGEVKKDLSNPALSIEVKEGKIIIKSIKSKKKYKKLVNTYAAHTRNMLKGVTEGHKYVLKICSSHFPMNVVFNNNQLIIKNFIGEKYPRTLQFKEGVKVKVEGDLITVEGNNKDLAGTAASDIEKLTRRADFDTRIFQDGIYMINKDGKDIK